VASLSKGSPRSSRAKSGRGRQTYGYGRIPLLEVIAEQRRFIDIETGYTDVCSTHMCPHRARTRRGHGPALKENRYANHRYAEFQRAQNPLVEGDCSCGACLSFLVGELAFL